MLLVALVAVLAACGTTKPADESKPQEESQTAEDSKQTEESKSVAESKSDESTSADESKPQETAKRIALLIPYRGDMSFNDSAAWGVESLAQKMGAQVETKIVEFGQAVDQLEATLVDAAEAGYDVVISGIVMHEFIEKHAEQYPNVTFVMFDGQVDWTKGDYKNVYCISYKQNEAAYLAGFVAAKIAGSDQIGFIAGMEQPATNDFLVGYVQGAKAANPDVKVAVSYVGAWNDPAKGKELALAMFQKEVGVIFGVAGGSGTGIIEAAVETGKRAIGVDADQAMRFDSKGDVQKAGVIATSVMKNIGASIERAVDLYLKGELKTGALETLGMEQGGVGLAENKYYEKLVPASVREEVEALKAKMESNEVKVDTGYGKSAEEMDALRKEVAPQ